MAELFHRHFNSLPQASKQHRLKRYHSQTYVNGSTCDLNSAPRETEVRFICEEGSSDHITRVDEPQSCSYVLTVHTPRTCQHPFLRPTSTSKPQPIKCQPALSPEQYMEYVNAQVLDTKRRVEQISEELKSLDEILSRDDEAASKPENLFVVESVQIIEEDEVDHEGDSAQIEDTSNEDADFWDGVVKPDSGESGERNEEMEADGDGEFEEQEDKKLDFKTIRSPSDLVKLANLLKETPEKTFVRSPCQCESFKVHLYDFILVPKASGDEQEDSKDVSPAKTGENTASVERQERGEDHEDDLMEEFEKEVKDISLPSSKIGEIRDTMEQEFDNIIDEAQQELAGEGLKGEFDRRQAAQTLETTLNQMMDKLEGKAVQDQQEEQTDRARGSPSLAPRQPADAGDGGDDVKVRITKYKSDGSPQNKMQVQEMGAEDPQVQYIKDVVKEQLEKAGLKAEGKIEVKIMTRGQPGDDDVGWLSQEDTKSFREILITLLTGGTEEVYKEQQRQEELETNYRFVWGKKREDSQPPSNTDNSDEMDF
ncbi:OS9 protein, partial [Polyodon spathula]|nr:OS9 protein [Polyodon spathula]